MSTPLKSQNSAFQKFEPQALERQMSILKDSSRIKNNQMQLNSQGQISYPSLSIAGKFTIKQEKQSDVSEQPIVTNENKKIIQALEQNSMFEQKKRRRNKLQTKMQIFTKQKDQGRGGNCIASNITKTLLRVIQIKIDKNIWTQFQSLIQDYKIKSQKQNIVILLLILYVFVKQQKISIIQFKDIFENHFLKSLIESKNNCEKKMQAEPQRRNFHLKNKKMYNKFIEINRDLYDNIKAALQLQRPSQLKLEQIENIISDTYDRKQREVQKAMNKIKSIILNHQHLRQLFGYEQNDVFNTFFNSIEYAYRRNLPKRSKQVITKVNKFLEQFSKVSEFRRDEETLLICYFATKYIGEKQEEIWTDFCLNLSMKNQFNKNSDQLQQMRHTLKITIPEKYQESNRIFSQSTLQYENKQLKLEISDSNFHRTYSLFRAFINLKNSLSS